MAFKPISKSDTKEKIKNYLMEGFIIRVDGRDETPLEVISREHLKRLPHTSNIGQCEVEVVEKIQCSHKLLYEVKAELSDDYSISCVSCSYSGCCQYATYGYYLD